MSITDKTGTPRSQQFIPHWFQYVGMGGAEYSVLTAIYSAIRPVRDGTFSRRGYCTYPQIEDMTCFKKAQIMRATKKLRERGILYGTPSTTHTDHRIIWTIPYIEVTEAQLASLQMRGWYGVQHELDAYLAQVEAEIEPTFLPVCASELGLPDQPSWVAVNTWRKIQRIVKKGGKAKMEVAEVLWRAALLHHKLIQAGERPRQATAFFVRCCHAIQGKTPTFMADYEAHISEIRSTRFDLSATVPGSKGFDVKARLLDVQVERLKITDIGKTTEPPARPAGTPEEVMDDDEYGHLMLDTFGEFEGEDA